jgi:hypothetical protein
MSDGTLFEYSKTEKPGWEKTVTTAKDDSSKTYVSYRNYFRDGIMGEYVGVRHRASEYGDELQLGLRDVENQTEFIISFKLKTQRGNYEDQYLIPLIQVLPNMEKGQTYLVKPYSFQPSDSMYTKKGVKVTTEDGTAVERKITASYYKGAELVEGDIPAIKFIADKLNKNKKKPDPKTLVERDDFIEACVEKLLEEHKSEFSSAPRTPNVGSADKAKRTVENSVTHVEDDESSIEDYGNAPVVEAKVIETKSVEAEAAPAVTNKTKRALPF